MKYNFRKYIIFWLSQTLSQLGSAITSFALILWMYMQNGSEMTVSLMSFFNYVPYVIVSLFAGTFVDNHNKKKIMLISDSVAGICSVFVFCLNAAGRLQIVHLYIVKFCICLFSAGFYNKCSGKYMRKKRKKINVFRIHGRHGVFNRWRPVFR